MHLGRKTGQTMAAPQKPNEMNYPNLHVSGHDLGLGSKDIGKTFHAKVKIKLRSHSENSNEKGKKDISHSFDVTNMDMGSAEESKTHEAAESAAKEAQENKRAGSPARREAIAREFKKMKGSK